MLRDEPADVIVVDSMHGAGLAVAELLDLPTVVLAHTLYRRWTQWAPSIMSLSATRATAGLGPVGDDRFVPDILDRCAAILGLMPEALDFPGGPDPANTHHVGPILPLDGRRPRRGRPRPARTACAGPAGPRSDHVREHRPAPGRGARSPSWMRSTCSVPTSRSCEPC